MTLGSSRGLRMSASFPSTIWLYRKFRLCVQHLASDFRQGYSLSYLNSNREEAFPSPRPRPSPLISCFSSRRKPTSKPDNRNGLSERRLLCLWDAHLQSWTIVRQCPWPGAGRCDSLSKSLFHALSSSFTFFPSSLVHFFCLSKILRFIGIFNLYPIEIVFLSARISFPLYFLEKSS